MDTLKELEYYCKEEKPVGAILLTGEWGCGKTYLIVNCLPEKLKETHIILRISLFGMTSVSEISNRVKEELFEELIKHNNGLKKINKTYGKYAKITRNIPFIPQKIKEALEFNPALLIEESAKVGNKDVVLVFDDLERTKIDLIDVLGCINEYCENKGFHTIIIANEEKIDYSNCTASEKNSEISFNHKCIKYRDIKEKIVQRTVQYHPDYSNIVKRVVEEMQFRDDYGYHWFLKNNIETITCAFIQEGNQSPHNIRSLKCALIDFERIYTYLKNQQIENLNLWLTNFMMYSLAYKSNICSEINHDSFQLKVKERYIEYDECYMLSSAGKWILTGDWDERMVEDEICAIKKQQQAKSPFDILRCSRIIDVDDEIIDEGIYAVISAAYNGQLEIDEYVIFIENSCLAREYNYPLFVNWKQIQAGLRIRFEYMKTNHLKEPSYIHRIPDDQKDRYSKKEWITYSIIEDFRNHQELQYNENKHLYCETMNTYGCDGLPLIVKKLYNVFDIEMARATFNSFKDMDNFEKIKFIGPFQTMWIEVTANPDFKIVDSTKGMKELAKLLQELEREYNSEQKGISKKNTAFFVLIVKDILEHYKKCKNGDPELRIKL